jgi:polyisoprenoid-binding protein YceI
MRPMSCCACLIVTLLARTSAQAQTVAASTDSVVYHVDPSSRLVVKTGKSGLLSFAGHTHVIRARGVRGALIYRPGTSMSSLRLTVPTESLEVLTPPDTAEIRKVTEAMRTEVLHVDKYPQMIFAADSLRAGTGKMQLRLALTMEGTTRTVPVEAAVTLDEDTVSAGGTFTAKQTDFGIKPFSGGPGGTVKVADRVTFCFDLVAVRQPAVGSAVRPDANDPRAVPGCVDTRGADTDKHRGPM